MCRWGRLVRHIRLSPSRSTPANEAVFPSWPVFVIQGYASRFAAPVCENECRHDAKEPTIAQLLQEKTLYSFSEWPKVLCSSQVYRRAC